MIDQLILTASLLFLGKSQNIPRLNPQLTTVNEKVWDINYNQIEPILNCDSALSMDLDTNTVFYNKNIHEQHQIASLTKLITILTILDYIDNPKETITVDRRAVNLPGSTMKLLAGEKISFYQLLQGALISSANDAAYSLCYGVFSSLDSCMDAVNLKANELGMSASHFANPAGYDDPNNYSTPYDLIKLALASYNNKLIKNIVKTRATLITSYSGHQHYLASTNKLLGNYLGVVGLKTGTTKKAKEGLISIARNNHHNILSIILGSHSRFRDSKSLIEWSLHTFHKKKT